MLYPSLFPSLHPKNNSQATWFPMDSPTTGWSNQLCFLQDCLSSTKMHHLVFAFALPTSFFLCCSLRTGLFNKTLACIVCLSLSFLGNWTVVSRIMRYTSLKCFYHNGEMDTHTHTYTHIFKDAHLWLGITSTLHLNQHQTQVKVSISNYDHTRNLSTSPLSTWTFFPFCLWCLCSTCINVFILLSSTF